MSPNTACNVTRVGSETNDVTSVNKVLQQCTGKVVRLNIQLEITYSTTVVQFNTAVALVVLMERLISSVRVPRQKQRDISRYGQLSSGSALITYESIEANGRPV